MNINNNYSISDLLQSDLSKRKFILYGAGTAVSSYARICVEALTYYGITPHCFIDDDRKRWGSIFLNIPIYSPEYLETITDHIILISSNYFDSIFNTLNKSKNNNSNNVYSLSSLLRDCPNEAFKTSIDYREVQRRLHTHNSKLERIKSNNNSRNKIIFNAIDIQVTEKCSMKCIDCSNLMQYYEKPIDADTSILMKSLSAIFNNIDYIYDSRVLGGEPFMYKELPILLKYLAESNKTPRVTVYTNGTFVPKIEILESLTNPKIEVEITDYDILSKNHDNLVETFIKFGIRYITHKPQNWTDSARIINNHKSETELHDMFEKCCVNDAVTLLHGKLYHCPFSANAYNLNGIPKDDTDYIDINKYYNNSELRNIINNFYFGKPYLTACKSCLGRDYSQPLVIPAIQTRKFIPINLF